MNAIWAEEREEKKRHAGEKEGGGLVCLFDLREGDRHINISSVVAVVAVVAVTSHYYAHVLRSMPLLYITTFRGRRHHLLPNSGRLPVTLDCRETVQPEERAVCTH